MNATTIQGRAAQFGKLLRITLQSTFLPACQNFGLTYQQFAVLLELSRCPELTAGELSDRTCILRSNFAAVANKLRQRGLVFQKRSEEDRRYCVLVLTEQGEEFVEEIMDWLDKRYAPAIAELPEEVITAITKGYDAFEVLATQLEAYNKTQPHPMFSSSKDV